jgi:hypothetical protein
MANLSLNDTHRHQGTSNFGAGIAVRDKAREKKIDRTKQPLV